MNTDTIKQFAEELKENRENKNITLKEINSKTRIDITFLEAIESGNFSVMPEVYIRAFIREYAKAVELDSDLIMKKYDMARSGKVDKPEEETEENSNQKKEKKNKEKVKTEFDSSAEVHKEESHKKKPIANIIWGTIVAFVAIFIIVYFLFIKENSAPIVKETPYEEVLAEKEKTYEEVKTLERNEAYTEPHQTVIDSLVLKISATDTCWVGITADKTNSTDFILYPERTKEIKAKSEFEVILGNASGVHFALNGKEMDYKGKSGAREKLLITKDGITIK